jgi:hypothetical protein
MPDEADPPRKTYGFKPKEFERVNAPRPEGDTAPPPPAANDVFAIREEIRRREIAAGMDVLKPAGPRPPDRRRRDYWMLLLVGNALLLAMAAIIGFNAMTTAFAFGGGLFYTLGLTWVMWGVMDRY